MEMLPALFIGVGIVAFLAEYMDASLGMGFGTTLTPLLLAVGFGPREVVPAVLLGQMAGGIAGGYFHHRLGNISLVASCQEKESEGGYLVLPAMSPDSKAILVLASFGVIGSVIGAVLAVNIPATFLRLYIGAMVLGIGIFLLLRRNQQSYFSLKKLIGVGLLSAFNKGMSGGGYGPLVTGGQILNGRGVKCAIGSTTVAEISVVVAGFLTYLLLQKGGIYWPLAAATSAGSFLAGPLAALTVKKVKGNRLKLVVGLVISILGILTLTMALVP